MSDNEENLQERQAEEEPESTGAASAELPDTETPEGDPPIIIQRGG